MVAATLLPTAIHFFFVACMLWQIYLFQAGLILLTSSVTLYTCSNSLLTSCFCIDAVVQKMQQNNVFTIAKRNVEGQDMLYQSLKLTNGIWVLNELKIQPGNPHFTVS